MSVTHRLAFSSAALWLGSQHRPVDLQRRRASAWMGAAGLAAMAPAVASRPGPAAALEAELREVVQDEQAPLASLSALVVHGGEVVWEGQFGHRRLHSPDPTHHLPVTRDTLFRVASITKLATAVVAMRLVEQGRLKLDEDIGRLLGFEVRNPHRPDVAITLRMLLSHTATLCDNAGTVFPAATPLRSVLQRPAEAKESPWLVPAGPGLLHPGRSFSYCNFAWGVIATLMEAASGERFDRLMARELLQPLGMAGGFDASGFTAAEREQVAVLYRKRAAEGGPWRPAGPWVVQSDDFAAEPPQPIEGLAAYVPGTNGTLFGPQGRLRTRVQDLGALMLALIPASGAQGPRPLKGTTLAQMLQPQWRRAPDGHNGDDLGGLFNAWGLGLQRITDRAGAGRGDRLLRGGGFRPVGHFGFAYGLHSGFWFDPAQRCGFVYAIGGTSADNHSQPGRWSSMPLFEERVADALARRALGWRA